MKTFAEVHPELISEWDVSNGDVTPDKISYGSNRKVVWKGKCGHIWQATVKNRSNGSGCPYCSGNKVLQGFNDLATLYPKIAEEWDESNKPLTPDMVSRKANREITWKCLRCGQTWKSRIADRTDGHGCPVCSGERLVKGINDFATEHPTLAAEWSDRNCREAHEYRSKSRECVWWKCRTCGYEWQAVIDSRVKGISCPECRRRERRENIPYNNIEEERRFKLNAIRYYAEKTGTEVLIDDDSIIGVKLDVYFPEQKAAIVYSRPLVRECLVRRENAVNWLCFNAGIRLFRILPAAANEYDNCACITLTDKSPEVLGMALQVIFDMLGIPADIDIERDLRNIKQTSGPTVLK